MNASAKSLCCSWDGMVTPRQCFFADDVMRSDSAPVWAPRLGGHMFVEMLSCPVRAIGPGLRSPRRGFRESVETGNACVTLAQNWL